MKSWGYAVAVTAALLAGAAAAKPRLGDQPSIREGLFSVAIAYEISEVCPSIRPRMIAGIMRLNALRSQALRLGYTRAEVDAFMEDETEKQRLEALARQELHRRGAIPGDVASHCRLGEAEIAAGSLVGQLLR